jgi:septal ring factor EnvC (AmiA/AmiB activator)
MPIKNQEVLKMAKLKNLFFILLTVVTLAGSTFLVGCGGGVDAEQIQQLNDLKAAVDALQSQVNAKNDEKSSLQKQIADQEAKVKEIQGITDQMRKNCP